MTQHSVTFDGQHNTAHLAGRSMVFHCHYYNCAIHQAIEDAMQRVIACIETCEGWQVTARVPSPIEGSDGNRETCLVAHHHTA